MTSPPPPLLALRGISKSYPGVRALSRVDFDLRAGEVHALAGENGAGKSTLLKVLAGIVKPDAGELRWRDRPFDLRDPAEALRLGIRLIHQELNLVPHLTVAENIFLGSEPTRWGLVRRRELAERARRVLEPLSGAIDPGALLAELPVGEQQLVEIAKALAANATLIAMDEPTSALTAAEVQRLFRLISELKQRGVGFIYISHRLEELVAIADRVTVLRDGETVATRPMGEVTIPELIRMMVGRPPEDEFPTRRPSPGDVILRAEDLRRDGALRGVTFELRRGEILGLAGLMGSGRTELLRALFGADPLDGGRLLLEGRPIAFRSPSEAISAGIALAPEDRKQHGLLLPMTVAENITLPFLRAVAQAGWIRPRRERAAADRWIADLGIKTPSRDVEVRTLSGGNQQKVVLAKWLFTEPRVLLLDEPTRGIDVGAKAEIYALMAGLAERGMALVMASSELPEVLGMSDRIAVMHEGHLRGILPKAEATPERIMHLATGQEVAAR